MGTFISLFEIAAEVIFAPPMETPPLQCNADSFLNERIAGDDSGIGRRDFLRIAGISGLACTLNPPCRHPEALSDYYSGIKADTAIKPNADFIVGLDIGTSKVCVAVAERRPEGTIKIHGFGEAPSRGVRGWGISDVEAANECVRGALVDAEMQTDVMIRSVVLAVGGASIDVSYGCSSPESPDSREELSYGVKGDGVLKRIRYCDQALDPEFEIVRGAGTGIMRSISFARELGIKVEGLLLAPVASAQAVLEFHEKKRGALAIDMGAGKTSYSVFANGALIHSGCLPLGGEDVTHDLSLALHLPIERAEKLKIEKGSVAVGEALPGKIGFDGEEIERDVLNAVLRCREREIFESVKRRLAESGVQLDSLGSGVHLTGGCTTLRGLTELAEEVFGRPAQLAHVKKIPSLAGNPNNPRYSCAIGLVTLSKVTRSLIGPLIT